MGKTTTADEEFSERIVDIDVSSEMETSFLEYAYSVIYSRALPDARDGLKPVQRRILYTMSDMGIKPDKSHVKSARVVGQVMGQLHPHGDGAIYDALVRMAQPWSMRLPLVDGHGNFGSPDSGPAAMRYTECRMAPAALAMTTGLDEDTVDFRPNYDGKQTEPSVLPAALPQLLVNGATGIAVGMATNIAPHNLVEVIAGAKHLLRHPDASLESIMRYIPGPDFPTGGKIIGLSGVKEAYETGRGSFRIRATASIEQVSPRRKGIVVTQMPYAVGPEKIIEQIKTLVQSKKISGIADVKDLTDLANGTRLVIEVKNGINPEAMLEQLYKKTKLEDSFSINAVALVEGQPRTLPILEMLRVFLDHRLDVTLRRSQFRLRKAQDRLHLVEGLLIAIVDIDDVIALIRRSEDAAEARKGLMDVFDLTELQATYILDLQLRRLTKFSTLELQTERDELLRAIAELELIIGDPQRLADVVADELTAVASQFGTPRRTILGSEQVTSTVSAAPLEVADDPCWVVLSSTGLIAAVPGQDPLPPVGEHRAPHDVIVSAISTTARADIGLLTNRGRLYRLNAVDLPTLSGGAHAPQLAGGSRASDLVALEPEEKVLALSRLDDSSLGWALGTAKGVVKRTAFDQISKDVFDIIRLDEDDEVVGVLELLDPEHHLVFVTDDAQLLHFPASAVRPQGRSGAGIAGIKLADGASVLSFGAVSVEGSVVVSVAGADDGLLGRSATSIKVSDFSLFPAKGRATGGVRCQRLLRGETQLVFAWVGAAPAVAADVDGKPMTLPDLDPRRDGSGSPTTTAPAAIGSGRSN